MFIGHVDKLKGLVMAIESFNLKLESCAFKFKALNFVF